MGSAICGGVIPFSQVTKNIKKGDIWADMMAYIMPDKHYNRYIELLKADKKKEATKIFEKYAVSQI